MTDTAEPLTVADVERQKLQRHLKLLEQHRRHDQLTGCPELPGLHLHLQHEHQVQLAQYVSHCH